MHSKSESENASDALHYLICLSPELVLPSVIQRLSESFELISEPHCLTNSMDSLTYMSQHMVQNPGYS
ncbi:unnamed protein product [Cyprideis torosa]|uniref:Proteasome activator Blm10 middle HEAT repeats region domain-containing protein n=1 Tax=Cyprideis torosa TaxID=163714 RepID=A0A7R8ZT55_9CRUS|nr:unnamed protein product [Cyprideis torosa]CAG0907702.1 unnamed protein product [Cyprideis torosa]